MTLSSSLSSALSGLTAASRAVEIVSSNVANAMTGGFARRDIVLASEAVGGNGAGVRVAGVTRVIDERALSDQRQAEANSANASLLSEAWQRIEMAIGYPTEAGSLGDRVDAFEAALIDAASRPDETIRLESAVFAAGQLVEGLQSVETEIQSMRMAADADIATMVEELNTDLEKVEQLNWQIFRMSNGDQDVAGLMDQRQALVASISEIVPVRVVQREGNRIALFAPGGAALIDGPAAEIGFDPTPTIVPQMTLENGLLSGLTLNGQPLASTSRYGSMDGGRLAAAFEIRDTVAVEAQIGLDALARDLIDRFQDSSLDPTIPAGGAGLFTDSGGAFDPSDEIGISGRISVNSIVDPDSGGSAWHLRDGLGATAPGDVGNAELLSALAERLSEARSVASGPAQGGNRSLSGLVADYLSDVDLSYRTEQDAQAFHATRAEAFAYEVAKDSVDTDEEMQKLLLIEQVYAANAQVVRTIDALMDELMEI